MQRLRFRCSTRCSLYVSIGADFAGATGAIAPAVKILRGRRPAVTGEVAPVNHGGKAPVIHGGHASDDEKCLSFIKRRMIINQQ